MTEPPRTEEATRRFRSLAEQVLDGVLAAVPETATRLGDHRFDDQLTDLTPSGIEARRRLLVDALSALDQVDDSALSVDDQVDLESLRTMLAGEAWALEELRAHETDPLVHLPVGALYDLIARPAADPASRLRAVAARLAAVPARLANARQQLRDMSRVHVETAIGQARGLVQMIEADLGERLAEAPALGAELEPARVAAGEALAEHIAWLEAALPESDGDPRLGAERYAARLWYALDTELTPDRLLVRAESDLQAIEEEIAELASQVDGAPPHPDQVRAVLDRLAADNAPSHDSIVPLCEQALAMVTDRVAELDLVTIPDDPVRIIVMPESRRGVAVAYCDPPGPLEDSTDQETFFSVAPAPAEWPADRVASFYREYNRHMLRNLTVHEAMPGHVLQLAHSARATRARAAESTRVRAACMSGPFVEGWAVYAEAVLAQAGLGLTPADDAALRLQQLKMQLRSTINAILDVRVQAHGMTEAEAMTLMTRRGHQEEGEAAGKWRRALLTSAQLTTYYVGYHEVSDLAASVRAAHPEWSERQLHDSLLAHGSPAPRHLRTLLNL